MNHQEFVAWLVQSGFQFPENTDDIEGIKVNDSHYCTIAEFKEMKELIDQFQGVCEKEDSNGSKDENNGYSEAR